MKQVKKSWTEEVDRSSRRIIRDKNRKIIVRDIIIVLLIALIVFSVYQLNELNFFDKYFKHEEPTKEIEKEKKDEDPVKEEQKEPTLDELIEKYAYLLDKVYINEESNYITDFYSGKLTPELNNVDFNELPVEEDYNVIDEDTIIESYYDIFKDDYESISFDYNGNKIRYINKLQYYITDKMLEKNDTNIKREITNIIVDGNNIIITTIEGIVKGNKLYNVLNLKEVRNYKNDNLSKYSDKLNEMTYTFNEEKLISIK